MKRVLLGLVFLLLSSTEGSNGIRVVPLPDSTLSARIMIVPRQIVCPGSYNYTTWTNCLGTFTFASGNKYVGQWMRGFPNGQATFTYVSGSKYVGEWRDNTMNGYGVYTWADGETKEGIWKNGRLNK